MTVALSHEALVAYCLGKPGAWEDEPWEGDLVAKVHLRIFAFLGPPPAPGESGTSIGLKCGPTREVADEWLLRYPGDAGVMPYIGRSGWNTLRVGSGIPDDEILEAVDTSYRLVVSKIAKRHRPEGWD